jgi:hypothetical protein
MSNPFSGIITSEMKTLYTNMIDALLEATALTLNCRLIYGGTKLTICPNCVYDPMSGKSSNRYKTGGPVSFPKGQQCPVCAGVGSIPTDTDEELSLMVIYDSLEWQKMGGNNRTAQTGKEYTLTFSKLNTYTQLKQAKEIIIDTTTEETVVNRFVRVGLPEIYGFGASSYVMVKWERNGA